LATQSLQPSFQEPLWKKLFGWMDADYFPEGAKSVMAGPKQAEFFRFLPFALIHLGCFAVLWVGVSPAAVITALALYVLRMFAITGFYHRYFSHRTYATSRAMQFIMALWGNTSVQKGALWWASHHRHHHKHSDAETDTHSPVQRGFLYSHMGWIAASANMPTDYNRIKDFARYPELVWLNRLDWVGPLLLALVMLAFGALAPEQWHTNPLQMLVWGFFVSTSVLWHGTFSINSLSHVWGKRRYKTTDTSRNNPILALITMGEGWHNNHHFYQGSTSQGFYWWEFDFTYYGLKLMSLFGLVWDLHPVPDWVKQPKVQIARR
jgi:stearoyl-CoA desaturase (Delta-9 desaturase)